MNQAESASVEQLLLARGWSAAVSVEEADLVVVNTCSVRITAETRVFGRLAYFAALKKKRSFFLVLTGCMAQRLHDEIRAEFPCVDVVVGMFEKNVFPDVFQAVENNTPYVPVEEKPAGETYFFAPSSYSPGAFQSFVPIMNGCNNFCSYCIVPYVRGREVSRDPVEVVREVDSLIEKGVREITLLGQNVNSYRWENSETKGFPSLLSAIARRVKTVSGPCAGASGSGGRGDSTVVCAAPLPRLWIRFMSSHPKDFSDELIAVIASEESVCKMIHLPAQHGSSRVLKAMNRGYTREAYIALAEKIRRRIPDASLSTDILVGFPGETEEDVEELLSLMREVRFESAYMYHFNPREGTKAFSLPDQIPERVRKERLDRVISLQMRISAEEMRKRVGRIVPVLIESTSRNNPDELFGHTERGEMVVFEDALSARLIGSFVRAELLCLRGRTFRAKMCPA